MYSKTRKENLKTKQYFQDITNSVQQRFYPLCILQIFSYVISISTSSIFYTVRQAEHTFISARMARGSGSGPILRIAGVSPAMLSACKSPSRYHLTLIGPNPETGSTPMRFQTRYFSRFLHRYSSRNYAPAVAYRDCFPI